MTHTPHDGLVKHTLEDPKNAAPVLRAALPAAIASQCDWSTLKLVDRNFTDQKLRGRHTDLLYEVRVGRHRVRALIYALLEHKSECDPLTVVQMFVYVGRVVQRYARVTEGGELRVPLVLPVILYHSTSGWTAATELAAGYGDLLDQTPELRALAPNLRCGLLDVSDMSDQELRTLVPEAVPSLMLWVLRDGRNPARFLKTLGFWAGVIEELLKTAEGRGALEALFNYISTVLEITRQEFFEALADAAPEAKEAIMTLAEQLRREGRDEGRLEGRAAVLQRQLERKFGALSDDAKLRIQRATEQQLDGWLDRILIADSLEAVFSE